MDATASRRESGSGRRSGIGPWQVGAGRTRGSYVVAGGAELGCYYVRTRDGSVQLSTHSWRAADALGGSCRARRERQSRSATASHGPARRASLPYLRNILPRLPRGVAALALTALVVSGATLGLIAPGHAQAASRPQVSLTVPDANQNDIHGIFVDEGESVSIDVELTSRPSGSVSVRVTNEDPDTVTVWPTSLRFTTSNWNVAQAARVTAAEDSDADNEYYAHVSFKHSRTIARVHAYITVYDKNPAAPEHFKARPGDQSVTLSWSAPSVPDTNDQVTGYEYRRCNRAAADCLNDSDFAAWQSAGSSTSTKVTSLTNGSAYTFQVRAVAGQDKGLVSSKIAATPTFDPSVQLTVGWVHPGLVDQPASEQERFWSHFPIAGNSFPTQNGITAGRKLNFAADTLWASGVRSVKLELSGANTASRTDSTEPFTLFASYPGEVMPAGEYTLKATSYSGVNAGGKAGTPQSVTFTLAADNDKPTVRILCAEPRSVASSSSGKRLGVQVLFSELVSGFGLDDDDIEVTNVEEGGVLMSRSLMIVPTPYSVGFSIPADATGAIQVKVPADAAEDPAGNGNTAATPLNLAQNRTLSVADASGTEGTDDTIDFEVTLNAANDCETVSVNYATADGTATAGADYTAASGTLQFGPGETTKTVEVSITDDAVSDSGETFTLELSSASGATIADAMATGTIDNDEFQQQKAAPQTVTGLTASNATQTTVDLAWTLPTQPSGVTVTGVEVQQLAADETWSTVTTLPADATSHTLTGLAAGTSYSFRIRLATNSGNAASETLRIAFVGSGAPTVRVTRVGEGPVRGPFTVRFTFSEDMEYFFRTRIAVDNGALPKATLFDDFLTKEDARNWTAEVTPAASGTVTVSVGAGTARGRISGLLNAASEPLVVEADLGAPAAPPGPAASFHGAPASHDGETAFTVELRFDEEFPLSYRTLRDSAFDVTNGRVTGARRFVQGRNQRWEIAVAPSSAADVVIALPAATDCAATGAICTADGRGVQAASLTVGGRAAAHGRVPRHAERA